jgi:hypothetical protein
MVVECSLLGAISGVLEGQIEQEIARWKDGSVRNMLEEFFCSN